MRNDAESGFFRDIDEKLAWSPFEPDQGQPWDVDAAAHLYRRAGFAANWTQLHASLSQSPGELVDALVRCAETPDQTREFQAMSQAMVNTGEPRRLAGAWLHRMLNTPCQTHEKMTLFWHGHFATGGEKVTDARMLQQQHELLRSEALGSFAKMTHDISSDAAMLIYLDSVTNRKAHPNENFARELMELFCLGEGNYSEVDIREIARCFTGWQVKREKFRFNRYDHDFGEKTIFGKTGEFNGEQAVDLVLQQEAAPYFIAGKLFRLLVMDEPTPDRRFLAPLAATLRESNWEVGPVVQKILKSRFFYSHTVRNAKIRSPIELACGLLRALDGSANSFRVAELTAEVGQSLFFPPNVKGWDGGRTWINSSTLVGRANLVYDVLHDEHTRFGGKALADYLQDQGLSDGETLVGRLETLLVAPRLSEPVRASLIELANRESLYDNNHVKRVVHALAATPEFQLC